MTPALPAAWAGWLAENLLRGVPEDLLVGRLTAEGLAGPDVRAACAEVRSSPIFAAAGRLAHFAARSRSMDRRTAPLARYRAPAGQVPRRAGLSVPAFYETYVAGNFPVVLADALAGCPALAAWSPARLAERAGAATVRIMAGRDGDPNPHARQDTNWVEVRFADWLAEIQGPAGNDRYMVAANRNLERPDMAPLLADLQAAPRFVAPDPPAASLALWLGPAGTRTALHRDPHPVLLVQAFGRKRFRLIQPRDADLVLAEDGYYAPAGLVPADSEVLAAELGPGEALYLPWDWWHDAEALTAGASVTFARFLPPDGVQPQA